MKEFASGSEHMSAWIPNPELFSLMDDGCAHRQGVETLPIRVDPFPRAASDPACTGLNRIELRDLPTDAMESR